MNNDNLNIYCVEDGKDNIDNINIDNDDIRNKFKETLFHLVLCDKNENNTNYQISFVGIIHIKDYILLSLPKHFKREKETKKEKKENLKLILRLLLKYCNNIGLKGNDDGYSNIPMDAYFKILDYYKKYGIYKDTYLEYKKSFDGNINWKRTIAKSDKFISNGNLIFLPFIVKHKIYDENIISEVMKYIINDGYDKIGQFLDINIRVKIDNNINIEDNIDYIIKKLEDIKHNTYKDLTIKLINSLQEYLRWKNSNTEISFFVTKNFEYIWEKMLADYLDNNFIGIIEKGEKKNYLKFNNFVTNKKELIKKKRVEFDECDIYLNEDKKEMKKHILEFDYYLEDKNEIYLFDAKYYKEVKSLNYKQVVYHYERNNYTKNKTDYIIYDYLLLPCEKEYLKIHSYRKEDNIKIFEYYFDIRKVIKNLV